MKFGFKKETFLGIDFGTSSIKAVEFAVFDGKPSLVNYASIDLAPIEKGDQVSDRSHEREVVLYLKALLKRFKPGTVEARVALPAYIGLLSVVDFPKMKEEELEDAIRFEARKYIPTPLEEVALSWEVIGKKNDETTGVEHWEILLVAALNKEVQRYQSYIEEAGLKMALLELETFSIARALLGNDKGKFLVIDIGSRATNLMLVEGGYVKMSRNLDLGGKDFTRTLVESLHITTERAETLKKSGKDFLNKPESALIFPAIQMIIGETQRMFLAYQARGGDPSRLDGVVLSGGSAAFTGLSQYLSTVLGLPVIFGDPWSRVVCDKRLEPFVRKLGTSFTVAIGLALSGVENTTKG